MALVLYNYYDRKMCPQLAFADAKKFFMCASLSVGEDLLPYLNMVHERDNISAKDVSLSVTETQAIQACEIAAELGASSGYPDVALWPIAKVAVLLLDQTKKKCLIEFGADSKGVWSIIEKEYDETTFGNLDGPYMLQELAMSEVQSRTGIERSDLLIIDETLAYSLSKKRTTTKLFIVEYKKTKGKLEEISLEELITSMTGPVFVNDPFLKTTSVVDYYHILPYKEILQELLDRKWPAELRHGLHSVTEEKIEEQYGNSTSKMRKQSAKLSTPKQNKRAIKATAANSSQNSSISKQKRGRKRKAEASGGKAAEFPDGNSPIIENASLNDVETSKLLTTAAVSAGPIVLQSGGQVDKNKTEKQSIHGNTPHDDSTTEASYADPVLENSALEPQTLGVMEKSGGVTEDSTDHMYDLVRPIQKIRDELLRKENIIQERSIECDMDILTILNEGKMTPKALSILDKYKGTCSNMTEVDSTWKKMKEVLQPRNKCEELEAVCNKCDWMLPRYAIVALVSDGMFRACVHLTCPYFDMSIMGSPCPTAGEAKCSAAANMISELEKKAEEEE